MHMWLNFATLEPYHDHEGPDTTRILGTQAQREQEDADERAKRVELPGRMTWLRSRILGKLERVGIASSSITAWSLVWD